MDINWLCTNALSGYTAACFTIASLLNTESIWNNVVSICHLDTKTCENNGQLKKTQFSFKCYIFFITEYIANQAMVAHLHVYVILFYMLINSHLNFD